MEKVIAWARRCRDAWEKDRLTRRHGDAERKSQILDIKSLSSLRALSLRPWIPNHGLAVSAMDTFGFSFDFGLWVLDWIFSATCGKNYAHEKPLP
jgi:hypothetical protein